MIVRVKFLICLTHRILKAGFHIVVSGRFGSFRVVPSLSERRRQLKRPDTTGDFHMVVWGRLVVVWNAVVKTGPGADNTIFSGKLVQNGGCSRSHGRSAGIFTSACHSSSQKDTATKAKA